MAPVPFSIGADVEAVIAKHFGTKVFTYVTTLRDRHVDGGLDADSLDLVGLAVALEDRFEIKVTDDEAENAETVGQVIALVRRKVATRNQPPQPERTARHG